MAAISNITDFREYLYSMLGAPVVNVELFSGQVDNIIYDSVQDFHRYTYGESTYRDVIILPLSAGTSAYQLDSSVESIFDISLSQGKNGINDLFTATHTLLYNDFINGSMLGIGGASSGPAGLGGAMAMGSFDTAMIYLKEIEDHFVRKYTCSYSGNTNIVRVWPTPNENCVGMLQVYRRETAEALYNNPLLKKLVKARCMILWGLNAGKYTITLSGGSTINAAQYIDKGERDEEKALDSIKAESHPVLFMVG